MPSAGADVDGSGGGLSALESLKLLSVRWWNSQKEQAMSGSVCRTGQMWSFESVTQD